MTADRAAAAPPLSHRGRRLSLAAIIAAIAVVGIMLGLTLPLLSLILAQRGTDSQLIGLNAATAALALILAAPFIPRLIARLGLVPLMLGALILEIAVLLALPVVDNVYGWFPLRFLMGMGASALFSGTEAWISRIAANTSRGRTVGLYAAVLSAGLALGPALIPLFGIEGFRPFLAAAAIIALAIPLLIAAAPSAPHLEGRPPFGIGHFVRLMPVVAGAVMLFGLIDGADYALLAPYLVGRGLTPGAAATMLSVGGLGAIALQVPIGWLADRRERYPVMLMCGGACLLLPLLLPWTSGWRPALGLTLFVWLGIAAGLYTVALAIIGERYSGPTLVTANAALGMLYGVGSMIGPSLAGGAMDRFAAAGFPLALSGASGLFLLASLWLRPWRRPPAKHQTGPEKS